MINLYGLKSLHSTPKHYQKNSKPSAISFHKFLDMDSPKLITSQFLWFEADPQNNLFTHISLICIIVTSNIRLLRLTTKLFQHNWRHLPCKVMPCLMISWYQNQVKASTRKISANHYIHQPLGVARFRHGTSKYVPIQVSCLYPSSTNNSCVGSVHTGLCSALIVPLACRKWDWSMGFIGFRIPDTEFLKNYITFTNSLLIQVEHKRNWHI